MRDNDVSAEREPIDFAEAQKQLKSKGRAEAKEGKPRQKRGGPGSPPPGLDPRRLIRTGGGRLAKDFDESTAALAAFTIDHPFSGVYAQSGTGRMVTPQAQAEKTVRNGIEKPAGALLLKELSPEHLRLTLNAAARFERFSERHNDWNEINPPIDLCKTILAPLSWPHLEVITGTIEAPTLRPDGSILDQPGFDADTGLLYVAGAVRFPKIPDQPTKDDARQALDFIIRTVMDGFPFVNGAARSVALAAILSALVRRSLRSAPLAVVSAPRPGCGKTLLATITGIIATGRPPIMVTQAERPEEEPKRLLGLLTEQPPIIVYDNISRDFRGDCLCTVLTEPVWSERVLGFNRTLRVSTAVSFMATGNNPRLTGDLAERALECRLDPNSSEPEEREFGEDLRRIALRHRGELVVAALTVMRAYVVAGSPRLPIPQAGRFEEWSDLVRKPLVWLGEADPVLTRAKVKAADPIREKLLPLLQAWLAVYGDRSATVKSACLHSNEELRDALVSVREGRNGGPDGETVGKFIRRNLDRWETEFDLSDGVPKPLRDLCFRRGFEKGSGGSATWFVEVREY